MCRCPDEACRTPSTDGSSRREASVALRIEDIDLAADRELVERWQAGEHAAFDDLYRRYYTRLRSYCQRRVGDRDTAEEIAQEAFVKALQALPTFSGER